MKILLIAVNAKYIHTSLAVRALSAYADCSTVSMREFTINESPAQVMAELFEEKPDVACFSCYIWNIEFVCKIAASLKKVLPDCRIIFGGPEVSYDSREALEKWGYLDAVIRGEGERPFRELCENGFRFSEVRGITWRDGSEIRENKDAELIWDLDTLPFPYTENDLNRNKGKLIYYETSRGCPFRCGYCLSSTVHQLRFRSLEKVKEELLFFIRNAVPIVKLTDRTFNADKQRTKEILCFLTANPGNTRFHFEVAADLLDEELLSLLERAPVGLFQLEIGVQSTNPDTIRAIDRVMDFERIRQVVTRLRRANTVHLHLDLIAGLPHEDFDRFAQSFDEVFAFRPHMLQLGFLKLLKGTKLRREQDRYQYRFLDDPPYEVLQSDVLSYDKILLLKGVETVTELYYNSGAFEKGLEFLLLKEPSAFGFFLKLWRFYVQNGWDQISHSRNALYENLCAFASAQGVEEAFWDYLKLDYLMHNKPSTPTWSLAPYNSALQKARFSLIEEHRADWFRDYADLPAKEIVKKVHFEPFFYDVLGDGQKQTVLLLADRMGNVWQARDGE